MSVIKSIVTIRQIEDCWRSRDGNIQVLIDNKGKVQESQGTGYYVDNNIP